jgi:hypothetical protein
MIYGLQLMLYPLKDVKKKVTFEFILDLRIFILIKISYSIFGFVKR